MSALNFAAYLLFAFITSITPGPNNILLFSHGKNFGFKDSGKLMLAIVSGFLIILYAAGYGIAEIITHNKIAAFTLKIIGSGWLIYLAFALRKIDAKVDDGEISPLNFWNVILIQFVNIKAWIMAISGASAFLLHTGNIHSNVFIFSITFCFVGIPCMIIWIMLGDRISRLLKSERSKAILGNIIFLLLIISVPMIWINHI